MSVRKFITYADLVATKIIRLADGMDALGAKEKVDLVITDLNMPNVDGFELKRTIRQVRCIVIYCGILSSLLNVSWRCGMQRRRNYNAWLNRSI